MANIIICADGTWNRPEEDIEKDYPTNVLKLARAIKPSGNSLKQHVFYDWGLGSYHNSMSAGATGRGIHKNILDGYRYIVQITGTTIRSICLVLVAVLIRCEPCVGLSIIVAS